MALTKVTGQVINATTDLVVGVTTVGGGLSAADGFFSGITTITGTLDSTSTSTGALVVTGGVGVGGSLNVGGSVSVGGTLTYEDVTNIDSVGLITARNGIEVGASPGVAASISVDGNSIFSGITTFGGYVYIPEYLIHQGDGNTWFRFPSNDTITLGTGGSTRLTIDSNGKNIVGHTAAYGSGISQIHNTSQYVLDLNLWSADANPPVLAFYKSRNASPGGATVVQSGDGIGSLRFLGNDGTNSREGAYIKAFVDGTPGTDDMPGRITFGTTADGASGSTERLRITSSGVVVVGHTAATTSGASNNANFNIVGNIGSATGEGQLNLWKRTAPSINDVLGQINFCGATTGDPGAVIKGEADLAWDQGGDTSDHAGRLTFSTVPDNSSVASERMRIDSNGRVMIGHNASEAMYYTGNLQVQGTNSYSSAITIKTNQNDSGGPALVLGKSRSGSTGGNTVVQDNDSLGEIYFVGSDGTDADSRAASIRCSVDGAPGSNDMPGRLQFFTTADGASSETERMRIDSSGDLGLGTSDPDARLHVQSAASNNSHTSILATGNGNDRWTFGAGTGPADSNSDGNKCIRAGLYFDTGFVAGTTYTRGGDATSGYLSFDTNQNERMRITSAGDVFIGKTTNTDQERFLVSSTDSPNCYFHQESSSDLVNVVMRHGRGLSGYEGNQVIFKRNDATNVGSIKSGASGTSYNTSSDYRRKENNVLISDGIARLLQLKPYRFNFIDEPQRTVDGFFAHEVTPVVPEAVAGEKDAELDGKGGGYQELDYSRLVTLTIAALQEEIGKRQALEARIAALEST